MGVYEAEALTVGNDPQAAEGRGPVAVLGGSFVNIMMYSLDAIGMSPAFADRFDLGENEPVSVGLAGDARRFAARIVRMGKLEEGEVILSRRWAETIGAQAGDSIEIERCCKKVYKGALFQRIEAVGQPMVQIPQCDAHLLDDGAPYYRLVCEGSNYEFVVAREHVKTFDPDGSNQEDYLKLDRYQRNLLGLGLPVELSASVRELYLKGLGQEDRDSILDIYQSGKRDLEVPFKKAREAYGLLADAGYSRIYLAPFEHGAFAECGAQQVEPQRNRRMPWRLLCDTYLGTSSIVLRGVRPYDLDESKRIVRLSPDTMTFLGLDDADRVRLTYGDTSVTARAMPIDNYHEMQMTNLLADEGGVDNLIGIPTALRNELGIGSINTCVDVERDTTYLFVKHLNIQFLALLGLLLTLLQTIPAFDIDPLVVIVVFFVTLPFVLYAILSGERNRVG